MKRGAQVNPMKIEKTELWISCDEPLGFPDGKALRGFFGNLYRNRPEFHQHSGDRLIYSHPLIQYKMIENSALIVGLKEGAYLLKAIPELNHIELHHRNYAILEQKLHSSTVSCGLTSEPIHYRFATPWIGLNEENHVEYLRIKHKKELVSKLLRRILVGNILSMCKSLRYVVENKIEAVLDLEECKKVEIKQGVEMVAFTGEFKVNFSIPDFWGIGRSSARGYGTVIRGQT